MSIRPSMRWPSIRWLVVAGAVVLAGWALPRGPHALAAPQSSEQPDRPWLESLIAPEAGEDDNAPPGGAVPGPERRPPRAPGPDRGLRDQLHQQLEERDNWLRDPFRHLAEEMAPIVRDLDAGRTDEPVQQKQQQVLTKLDRLIDVLKQAQQSAGGGQGGAGDVSSPNPTGPASESTRRSGPGGQGPLQDPGQDKRRWSELPPRQREKILQSQSEGFPAGYEALLEEYYRRLSREQELQDLEPEQNSPQQDAGAPHRETDPQDSQPQP